MKNTIRLSISMLALCLLAVFPACEKDFPVEADIEPYEFASLDAAGGAWKPVLLSSAGQIVIPDATDVSSA